MLLAAAARAVAANHSAFIESRRRACLAAPGVMPTARAKLAGPPNKSMISEKLDCMTDWVHCVPGPVKDKVYQSYSYLRPPYAVQGVPMSSDLLNPPGPSSTVHERIKWIREQRGYASPRKAAAALGLPSETLRKHESGERGKGGMKDHHIRRYADAFKVNSFWLHTGEGSPTAIGSEEITPEEFRIIQAFRATRAKPT